jgi:hypothetical protein
MSGRGGRVVRRRWLLVGVLAAVVVTVVSACAQHAPRGSSPVRSTAAAPESPAARPCLLVGAYVSPQSPSEGSTRQAFRQTEADLGPLAIRRSFDTTLPPDFSQSAAAPDPGAGIRSFVSWKPPGGDVPGTIAGRYDRAVADWARSVPPGVFATAYHEPENDMSAGEFVALQRHLYTIVKGANPAIQWGSVYMAYWWDPDQPEHFVGDPAAWWPGAGFADFVGLDWYGSQPAPMTSSPSFTLWYRTMEPTGLPLYIVEYGQYELRPGMRRDPADERARAEAIRADAAWILAHPRIGMWLYWQAIGARDGDWRIRDKASKEAWRAVAALGCGA